MNENEPERDPIEAWLAATGGVTGAGPVGPTTDTDDRGGGPNVGRRLLLLSVLPWLAVVVLAGAALDERRAPQTAPAAVFPSAGSVPATEAAAAPRQDAATTPAPAEHAAAIVALRAAAAANEYIDTAAVESTAPAGGLTVVTLRAVRLLRVDGAWSDPHVIRAAVAVGSRDGETLAVARPWRLPAPPASAAPPPWAPVEDAALSAVATTTAENAGYSNITKLTVRRTETLPEVVSVSLTAVAPGDDDTARHEILLTADATAVLGASTTQLPVLPAPAEQP